MVRRSPVRFIKKAEGVYALAARLAGPGCDMP